jgi:hypothetical protein
MTISKKKRNPLDDITFDMPTLDEAESDAKEGNNNKPRSTVRHQRRKRETRQRNLLLPVDQLEWLDQITTAARGEKSFRQNAIVVAIFDVVMKAKVNLRGVKDEAEIRERIETAVKSQL